MGLTVDLNCDMGEGCAHDSALMDYVSSVNIACGFHAGDPDTMKRTVDNALSKGVAIGAHPGYPDRENFGRTPMTLPLDDVREIVAEQINALRDVCSTAAATLHHVKPHGALYNHAATNADLARAIAEAVRDVDEELVYFGLSGSVMIDEAEKLGLRTASEVFSDRTYQEDGTLTRRTEPNALMSDTAAALTQILDMIKYGRVRSTRGIMVGLHADTICIHGDSDHALEFARVIHAELRKNDVRIGPI
jgi:UPF0271 protein